MREIVDMKGRKLPEALFTTSTHPLLNEKTVAKSINQQTEPQPVKETLNDVNPFHGIKILSTKLMVE